MTIRTQAEWQCLQRLYSKLDTQALWLKLFAVVTWLWLLQTSAGLRLQLVALALFWLHECLLRTVQQRTAERLLQLEQALVQHQDVGMQWHTAWQLQRGGMLGLAASYLRQAIKPTVALTYIVLIALSVLRQYV